jgi:hypothetical protein
VTTIRLAQATSTATAADADAERNAKAEQAEAERKAKAEQNEAERKARDAQSDAERKARAADRDAEAKARAAEKEAERKAKAVDIEVETKARAVEIEARTKAQTVEVEAALQARDQALQEIEKQMQEVQAELRARRGDNSAQGTARRRDLEAQLADLRSKSDTLKRMRVRTVPSRAAGSRTGVLTEGEVVTGDVLRRRQDLYLSLDRTTSVELRDATVQRAAEVISQVSGIPIRVDPAVPADKRLTVVAQVTSVKNILAEVAKQMGLIIAPEPEGKGVILRPMSSLQVNGRTIPFGVANPPWSNTWGPLPVTSKMYSLTAASTLSGLAGAAQSQAFAESLKGATFNVRQNLGGVSITGLGNDRFVVASPAGPGENGVMLTVYRLEGSQLRVVSTTLHRFEYSSSGSRPSPPEPPKR